MSRHYYTEEQYWQVTKFVNSFCERLAWMKSPDGVDVLADKAQNDDGTISENVMMRWFIEFTLDHAKEQGLTNEQLHNMVAGATLNWAMSESDEDLRKEMEPIYKKYLKT
jgi:hypothetical protein